MARMSKLQSEKFDSIWEDSISWGCMHEYGKCNGIFGCFGEALDMLATGVDESKNELVLYYCPSNYVEHVVGVIPINAKGKSAMKRVVCHLMDNDFKSLLDKNYC